MTIPLGFAVGSNLTDLGRNLVAQETTRNVLQAALAAAAAQQGVARTQAGASRYSTDAQREGNQLMAMLRGLEQDRLREQSAADIGLRGRALTIEEALGNARNAGISPVELEKDRALKLRLGELEAEALKARNAMMSPQIGREMLGLQSDADDFNAGIPNAVAQANSESDRLYDEIVTKRRKMPFGSGKTPVGALVGKFYETPEADALKAYERRVFTEIPPKIGALGNYLVPETVDGKIRFSIKPKIVPGINYGGRESALPVPPPPSRLSVGGEFESDLSGPLDYVTLPVPNVPRGTPPTIQNLPVMPDTEPGFFSKLSGLTDRSPIAQLAQLIGRSSVRTPDAPTTPVMPVSAAPPIVDLAETIRRQSPLVELVPIIDFDPGRTSRTSPNSAGEAESIVLGYIDNLAREIQRLNQLPAQRGTESRKALVIKELSRLRQLMPGLN